MSDNEAKQQTMVGDFFEHKRTGLMWVCTAVTRRAAIDWSLPIETTLELKVYRHPETATDHKPGQE